MRTARLLLLFAGLALLPSLAHAQSGRFIHIGIGGGLSVPAGDLGDAVEHGVHGQAFLALGAPGSAFGTRIAIGYQHFDLKDLESGLTPPTGGTTSATPGTGSVLSGMANLTLGVRLGIVRPYITAGLGAFDLMSQPTGGTSASTTHFGVDGGAGLQLRLGPFQAFAEGRYENLFTDKGLDANATSAKKFSTQIIPVTFGVIL